MIFRIADQKSPAFTQAKRFLCVHGEGKNAVTLFTNGNHLVLNHGAAHALLLGISCKLPR